MRGHDDHNRDSRQRNRFAAALPTKAAELPARRGSADPLHGLHHHGGGAADGGAGLQDLRRHPGHLEDHLDDGAGGSGQRRGAAGPVPGQRSGGAVQHRRLRPAAARIDRGRRHLDHPQGGGTALQHRQHLRPRAGQQAVTGHAPAAAQGRRAAGVLLHLPRHVRSLAHARRARRAGPGGGDLPTGARGVPGTAQETLEQLRRLHREKQASLEP